MMTIKSNDGSKIAYVRPFTNPLATAEDSLEQVSENVYKLTRTYNPVHSGVVPVHHLNLDIVSTYQADFTMIPAASYNANQWGDGKEPCGYTYNGEPWSFAAHRAALPGGMFSRGEGFGIGIFADTQESSLPCSCSIFLDEGRAVHRMIMPEEEMPKSYLNKGALAPGYRDTALLEPGSDLKQVIWIVVGNGDYGLWLDTAWTRYYHHVKPWYDNDELWKLGITYAKESLWAEDKQYTGFSIGLTWDSTQQKWAQRSGGRYECGWCGQNISFGCSMLHDYVINKNSDSLDKGLKTLDCWAEAFLPSGLYCVHYDALLGYMPMDRLAVDSCNLGGAAENFIKADKLIMDCGIERPQYIKTAQKILDRSMLEQLPNGNYPSAYKADGSVITYEGSTGCFLILPMLMYYELYGDEKYYKSAISAMGHYYGEFDANGYTTAGALDTHCIDKESAYPLLASALYFYRLTSDGLWLDKAKKLAYYLSTWQWHYTHEYPKGSALAIMSYDTFGGTAVSTQHHHIDPYAVKYVPYLRELAKVTGEKIWQERATAIFNNATIGISDGNLVVMGKQRPTGSQDEAFMHTRWSLPYNVSQWLVSWPSAFRLEVLREASNADC